MTKECRNTQQKPKKKKAKQLGQAAVRIAVLALVLWAVFHRNFRGVLQSLCNVGIRGFFVLAAAGCIYFALDILAFFKLTQQRIHSFSFRQAAQTVGLGILGRVCTCSVGSFPMQGCFLYRCGLVPGESGGLIAIAYVLQKAATLLSAAGMAALNHRYLVQQFPDLIWLFRAGFAVGAVIIAVMLLLCASRRFHALLQKLLGCIPQKGSRAALKKTLQHNADSLYRLSCVLLENRAALLRVFLIQCAKILWLELIPWFCLNLLGEQTPVQTALLYTALALVLAGACPNVSGLGPTEAAFLLLFSRLAENGAAATALLLFRFSSYFFPFLVSLAFSGPAMKELREEGKILHEKTLKN